MLGESAGAAIGERTAGVPIGWGTVRDCAEPRAQCNWLDQRGIFSRHGNSGWQLMLVLIGFLVMIVALVPGARFWFGLLSRFGSIPATGPKPATTGRAALTRAHRPPPGAVQETTKGDSRGPVRTGGRTGPVEQRPDDERLEKQLKPKRQLVMRTAAVGAVLVAAALGGVAAAETTALYWLGVLTAAGSALAAFGVYEVAGFGGRWWSRRQLPEDAGDRGQDDHGDVWGGAVDRALDHPERAERADPESPVDRDDDGGAAAETEGPEPTFYVNALVTLAGRDVPLPGTPLGSSGPTMRPSAASAFLTSGVPYMAGTPCSPATPAQGARNCAQSFKSRESRGYKSGCWRFRLKAGKRAGFAGCLRPRARP